MSKIKLVIECEEQTYAECKRISGLSETAYVIANGTPIAEGDLKSRSILDDVWKLYKEYQPCLATEVYEFGEALKTLIDNAPSIGGNQNE